MDIPQPPEQQSVESLKSIWGVVTFFGSILISGGIIEYILNKRFVTKAEFQEMRTACTSNIAKDVKILLLENNEALKEQFKEALDEAIEKLNQKK